MCKVNNLKNFLDINANEGVLYAHSWYTILLAPEIRGMENNLREIMRMANDVANTEEYGRADRGFAHKVWTQIREILNPSVADIHPNVRSCLAMGREYYVHAIREYRSAYNAPLKEAKEEVDKIIREHYPNFRT